jgi:hypothetical protein
MKFAVVVSLTLAAGAASLLAGPDAVTTSDAGLVALNAQYVENLRKSREYEQKAGEIAVAIRKAGGLEYGPVPFVVSLASAFPEGGELARWYDPVWLNEQYGKLSANAKIREAREMDPSIAREVAEFTQQLRERLPWLEKRAKNRAWRDLLVSNVWEVKEKPLLIASREDAATPVRLYVTFDAVGPNGGRWGYTYMEAGKILWRGAGTWETGLDGVKEPPIVGSRRGLPDWAESKPFAPVASFIQLTHVFDWPAGKATSLEETVLPQQRTWVLPPLVDDRGSEVADMAHAAGVLVSTALFRHVLSTRTGPDELILVKSAMKRDEVLFLGK